MATLKARTNDTPWSAALDTQPPASPSVRGENSRVERSRLTEKIEAMADAVRRQETTYGGEGPAHDLETQIRAINARIEQLTITSVQASGTPGGSAAPSANDADRTLDLRLLVREQLNPQSGPETAAGNGAAQARSPQGNGKHSNGIAGRGVAANAATADIQHQNSNARSSPSSKRRGQERVPELRSLRSEEERAGRTVPLLALLVGGAAVLGGLYYTYGDGSGAGATITRSSLSGGMGSSNDTITTNILDLGNLAAPANGSTEPLGTRFAVAGIEGEAGAELAIQVMLPRSEIAPESLLLVRGIPEGASVSPAQKVDKDWAVRLGDLEDLRLTTPENMRGWFPFEVVLQRNANAMPETRIASIEIVAPRGVDLSGKDDDAKGGANSGADEEKTLFPDAKPAKPAFTAEMEKQLMERGEALMRNGDVAGARLAFQHLALRGSGRGAMALGKTFDPAQLGAADIRGLAPDADQAAEWYAKAAELGMPEGKAALQALAR